MTFETYYAVPGPMTDPKEYAYLLRDLPHDLVTLVKVVQGLCVHIFWAERYGLKLDEGRQAEVQLWQFSQRLARIQELDPSPLIAARPLEKRLVSNCRDFSTMMAGLLRSQHVPADWVR